MVLSLVILYMYGDVNDSSENLVYLAVSQLDDIAILPMLKK